MILHDIGSSTPASIPAWGMNPREQAHMTEDPNETFDIPNNKDPGNPVNNNIFTTNSMGLETILSLIMPNQL